MRLALVLTLAALPVQAAENCTEDAMLVFDGSGSMAETGFNRLDAPRIFEARQAVREVMPEIEAVRDVGLVIYGPSRFGDCASARLHFGPRPMAADPIIAAVEALDPDGGTPIEAAVIRATQALTESAGPGTVVLVTDGKETCGGSPCALAAELAADGGPTVHVIGFKVRGQHFTFGQSADYDEAETPARCLADMTGGEYVGAETLDELIAALRQTLGCSLLF